MIVGLIVRHQKDHVAHTWLLLATYYWWKIKAKHVHLEYKHLKRKKIIKIDDKYFRLNAVLIGILWDLLKDKILRKSPPPRPWECFWRNILWKRPCRIRRVRRRLNRGVSNRQGLWWKTPKGWRMWRAFLAVCPLSKTKGNCRPGEKYGGWEYAEGAGFGLSHGSRYAGWGKRDKWGNLWRNWLKIDYKKSEISIIDQRK